MQQWILRGVLLTLLLGCTGTEETEPRPGLYYWRTAWALDSAAVTELHAAGVRQLYVRLFDVDYDERRGEAVPRAPLTGTVRADGLSLTPVVYLVHRVFTPAVDVDRLARRLTATVDEQYRQLTGQPPPLRLQIDYDWTPGTRDAYFAFLRELKQLRPERELSVTVRLHQYRERHANGVPPADRGTLMCYNIAPVQARATRNAIFDGALLRGYLKQQSPYPLALDVALPNFAWGAAFRGPRFLGIVPAPERSYLVEAATTLGDVYLRAGDEVRRDGPEPGEIREAVATLRELPEFRELFFFDWQPDRPPVEPTLIRRYYE